MAEIYLMLDIEKVEHSKEHMMLDEFLGNIGGIYELIIGIFMLIFGGFIDFGSKIYWI